MQQGKEHQIDSGQQGLIVIIPQQIVQLTQTWNIGHHAYSGVNHQHAWYDDLVGRDCDDVSQENNAIQTDQYYQRVEGSGDMLTYADITIVNIAKQPNHRSSMRSSPHGSPEHKDGAVDDRGI